MPKKGILCQLSKKRICLGRRSEHLETCHEFEIELSFALDLYYRLCSWIRSWQMNHSNGIQMMIIQFMDSGCLNGFLIGCVVSRAYCSHIDFQGSQKNLQHCEHQHDRTGNRHRSQIYRYQFLPEKVFGGATSKHSNLKISKKTPTKLDSHN